MRGHLGLLQWVCGEEECHASPDDSWTLRVSLHLAQVGAMCVLPLLTASVPSGLQNAGRHHTHIGGGAPALIVLPPAKHLWNALQTHSVMCFINLLESLNQITLTTAG